MWLFSLLSGLTAVLCACNQQRAVSRQLTYKGLFDWMNDASRADHQSDKFAVPDLHAVLLVSLPRKFLHYSLETYMIGLVIYLGFLWRHSLEEETPGDNRNIFVFTTVSLFVCWTVVVLSDITNRCKSSVWKENYGTVKEILNGSCEATIGVICLKKEKGTEPSSACC